MSSMMKRTRNGACFFCRGLIFLALAEASPIISKLKKMVDWQN